MKKIVVHQEQPDKELGDLFGLFLEDINHNNYYFVKIPPLTLKSPIIPKSKISPVCYGLTRQGNGNE